MNALTKPLSVTRLWVILMVLTLASVATGENHAFGRYSDAAIIVLAAVKARWVVLDYMEARHVPGPWQMMYEAWLAAVSFVMCWIAFAT